MSMIYFKLYLIHFHSHLYDLYEFLLQAHFNMDNSKTILKFIFILGIWSFLVLGLLKLNDRNVAFSEHFQNPMSRRFLLQRENRYFEATSTTPDGMVLDDVLVDNRQGNFKYKITFLF